MFTGFVAVLGGKIHKSTNPLSSLACFLSDPLPYLTVFTSLVLSEGGEVIEIDLSAMTIQNKDISRKVFLGRNLSLVCMGC